MFISSDNADRFLKLASTRGCTVSTMVLSATRGLVLFRVIREGIGFMPMKVPHRWSVAQDSHCGAIHLYTPAGSMETDGRRSHKMKIRKNQEARKAEFERHGLTLLGEALSKAEIDRTL